MRSRLDYKMMIDFRGQIEMVEGGCKKEEYQIFFHYWWF